MHTTSTQLLRKRPTAFTTGTQSLPQKYFVAPEVFAEEQEAIFSKQWLLVGHQSQIPDAGDYVVRQVIGESLIVIRDKSGEIRGFFNVCRHRGTRLKEDACGHASAIQCPYHAWTYGLDGRLIGAPHMDEVPGFDKAEYSLNAVNLAVWEGFVFVNLVPKRDGYLPEEDGAARLRSEATARQRSGDFISLERWFAPLKG